MIDNEETWSTPQIVRLARTLFADAPLATRTIQSLRPQICPFDQLIPLVPPGSRVLDFGCGNGLFLGLLAKTGRIVEGLGLDVSARAIKTAQGLSQSVDNNTPLRFEDYTSIEEFSPHAFDVISMVDVIHHVPPLEQERLILSMMKALKPGGLFLYKDIATRPFWRASANRLHDLIMARQWIHYFPTSEVRRIALDHGLIVRQEGYVARLWYGHDILLLEKPLPNADPKP